MKNTLLASLALILIGVTTACDESQSTRQPGDWDPQAEPDFDDEAYLVTPEPSMGEFAHRIEPVVPGSRNAVGIVEGVSCMVGLWAPGSCEQTFLIEPIEDCVHTMEVGGEDACAHLYDVIPVDYSEDSWAFIEF